VQQERYLGSELCAQDAQQAHSCAQLHAAGAYELVPRQLHCGRVQWLVPGLAPRSLDSTQDKGVDANARGGSRAHAGISQHEESWPTGMRRLRPHLIAGFEAAQPT